MAENIDTDTVRDSEICSHAFEAHEQYQGAMAPPIYQTSLFTFPNLERFTEVMRDERSHFVYSRGLNPTVKLLEEKLAALERGEMAKAFGSGMGAISATMMTLLSAGDHVLLVNQAYGPTRQLLEQMARFGIDFDECSGDSRDVERALRPETRLIYIESPSSMRMELADLEGIASIARAHGILTAIDNTWATPLFQKPLTLGIDLSLHTLSKYIGGHSDLVGGAVIGRRELVARIFEHGHQLLGAALSPHSAFLALRGLRTLPVRMRQHQSNVLDVIQYLAVQQEITAIHHPCLATGEAALWVEKQLSGQAGLLSFEIDNPTYARIAGFINALQTFRIGVSWGGYESLAISQRQPDDTGPTLIRLAIGLEAPELLIEDLKRGFQTLR
ncbi:trans-sulfuration enzyme family protein [Salinicola rhizosphaerae]|uniref:Cystathionine gamma-synthase n=1 Tax=Salinicola rhizosphaerae TaxID=1443141 RepID=A0ABQ3E2H5_9GAMM|nr:aminotransferase class I/II-fold pyridoxal phosphate-dependent enzyme [Salinicola rhizosphaerae]GHB21326.1 cystathionine gamma-synthase [Salinicola rhizosphaerae]